MNGRNKLFNNASRVLAVISVIASVAFILGTGLGDMWEVVANPAEARLNPDTLADFGGDIGALDRIMAFASLATVAFALGLVSFSRKDKVLYDIQMYLPWIIGLVGIVGFFDIVSDVLQDNWDYAANSDNYNSYVVFVATATFGGILSFLGLSKSRKEE